MDRVVVGELSHGQPFFPVVLAMVYEDAQVLFNCLIHALCLTICLGMVCSGGVLLDAEDSEKFGDVLRDESSVTIMNHAMWESMVSDNSIS
jgi:uncharacterized membrane protein